MTDFILILLIIFIVSIFAVFGGKITIINNGDLNIGSRNGRKNDKT